MVGIDEKHKEFCDFGIPGVFEGFQKEILLPVATTDTSFQECGCGPYGKQYLLVRKINLPSPDPSEDPPKDP